MDSVSENKKVLVKSFECRSIGIEIIVMSLATGILFAGAGMAAFPFEKSIALTLFAAGFCTVMVGTVQYIRFYERNFCVYPDRITGSCMFFSGRQTSVLYEDILCVRAVRGIPVIVVLTEKKTFRFYVPRKDAFYIAELIKKTKKELSAKQI
ncbi:MAG: hypothetical protein IJB16_06365 [Clostridia bacterium]|nr:hypothetical protein [Clostridia bacterium]